jgi:hypothetical protein
MNGMEFKIPPALAIHCPKTPERAEWIDRLPESILSPESRWSLTLHAPFGWLEGELLVGSISGSSRQLTGISSVTAGWGGGTQSGSFLSRACISLL